MNNQKGVIGTSVLLLVLFGLLAVGVGAYYLGRQSTPYIPSAPDISTLSPDTTQTQTPQQPSANPDAVPGKPATSPEVADTSLFASAKYGFNFQYPNAYPVATVDYGSTRPFNTPPVAFVRIFDDKQTEGYLTINVSSDPQELSNCSNVLGYTKTVSINGADFIRGDSGNGGSNGYERIYKSLHNNYCYAIDIITFAGACINSGCDNRLWSEQTMKDLMERLDIYAQTFTFVDPSSVVTPGVHVDGMSKYVEDSFGYVFWYPSDWTVSEAPIQNGARYGGGTIVKRLQITNGIHVVYIDQFRSDDRSIEDTDMSALYDNANDVYYYFDASRHQWMVNFPTGHSRGNQNSRAWSDANPMGTFNPVPANIANNTMGGLHIFDGLATYSSNKIIPLSAHNFLVVETPFSATDNSYISLLYGLVDTIEATDPSVATPVGPYDQINSIQAEKDAFSGVVRP